MKESICMDISLDFFDNNSSIHTWWLNFNKTIWAKSKSKSEYITNVVDESRKFNAKISLTYITFQTEEDAVLFLLTYS